MYDWNNYDNDLAYSYDDYVESKDNEDDAYIEYLLEQEQEKKAEEFSAIEYESKMAQQMIDSLNNK